MPWKQIMAVRPEALGKADDLIIIPTQRHAIRESLVLHTVAPNYREPRDPNLGLDEVGYGMVN